MPIEHRPEHPPNLVGQPEIDQPQPGFMKERSPNQGTQEEKKLYLNVAFSFIGNVGEHYRSAGIEDYFEGELRRAGLVERLEEAGILPSATQDKEKREEALRHLYAGAVLGHVFGEELLSLMQEPSSWGAWMHKEQVDK